MSEPAEIIKPSAQEIMRRALLKGSAEKQSAVYIVPMQVKALEAAGYVIERWDAVDLHRTRWQRLVNTVADRWTCGAVPGNDEEAVEWAMSMLKDTTT